VKLHRIHITTKLGVRSAGEISRLVQDARIEWQEPPPVATFPTGP
jgi:hypothetical protein